jgi:bifunctional non-homologous end joining protein LigD
LVAEVSFTEWSAGGAMRHPTFMGLRSDKPAASVVREEPADRPGGPPGAHAARKRATRSAPGAKALAGVTLSHPDKLYFPEAGLAKRAIAQHYFELADRILPHLRQRPLSLVRCPDGWKGQCFYQKHAHASVDAAVTRMQVHESGGEAIYMGVGSAKALVALVQWGVIEFHPWASRRPRLERPDRIVFDFDPGEGARWKELVEAVQLLRTMLGELDLQGFLKTTGGKGLHVVVPIRQTLDWPQAKAFSKQVATLLAKTFPQRFTTALAKERRRGKIFIDYLRNAEGATAVAPYSVRARKNAPVATPIDWNELAQDVRYDFFNVRNIRDRVGSMTDPWAGFASTRQTVTKALAKRLDLHW